MFESFFPPHWTTIQKLMWLKVMTDRAKKAANTEEKKEPKDNDNGNKDV